ncbi:MAG: APC family permease [Janthinobacterium lividum]
MDQNSIDLRPAPSHLRRQLSGVGVLLLALSSLSPVLSAYGIGSDVLLHAGSGAAVLFLLGIGVALVFGVVYAELGSAYPYAGGDYVGVGTILGGWAGVSSMAIWAATSGPNLAFAAKVFADYAGPLAPAVPAGVLVFGALAAATVVALLAVRASAWITGLFLAVEMAAVLALIAAGLWDPGAGAGAALLHPVALDARGALSAVPFGVLALGGVSAAFGTVGGNQAIGFGEELRDPHATMGHVVLLSCMVGAAATALPVVAVALGAPDLAAVLRSPAPFTTFMAQVAGPGAARALGLGVALAVFNSMIATLMYMARLFFSMGRDAVFPGAANRVLMAVDGGSGVPRNATLLVGAFSAASCLLSSHVLLVFTSGLIVFALALVSLAVLVGRGRGLTGRPGCWRSALFPAAPVLGLAIAGAFAAADWADADVGRPSLLVMALIVAAAMLWHRLGLRRRPQGWAPRLG